MLVGGTSWGISGLLFLEIINISPDPQGKGSLLCSNKSVVEHLEERADASFML